MAAGQFRVKAGLDQQTARRLADDLVAKGARCLILDERGNVRARLPQPETLGVAPTAGHDTLGALAASMDGLQLATLDGQSAGHDTFQPETPGDEPTRPTVPMSAFGPPREQAQDLQLAVDLPKANVTPGPGVAPAPPLPSYPAEPASAEAPPSPPQATLPRPPAAAPGVLGRQPHPPAGLQAPTVRAHAPRGGGVALRDSPLDRVRTALADNARLRFAIGVFAALLLGFLPAALYAQSGHGNLDDIRARLSAEQDQAATQIEAWEQLDGLRSATLEEMYSTRRNIALGGLLIWAAGAGFLGFLWFRKIDWAYHATPDGRFSSTRAGPT